ncbi:MAG: 4-amino-4-deoxy-L-arabinose transferase-like glycosyltransferase [Glaciecola sp.]|jgi:4-amino-4-deoxy-L-arabinose transferase-like glycosyltransferase
MKGNDSASFGYRLLFVLIICTATILRFYDYSNIPFTHDEFSALFKTNYDNFSDLVYYGVKTGDTHPAGVQIFIYYWVKLFGAATWVVKLPFTLAGIASIYFLYKTSKTWFNETAALVIIKVRNGNPIIYG